MYVLSETEVEEVNGGIIPIIVAIIAAIGGAISVYEAYETWSNSCSPVGTSSTESYLNCSSTEYGPYCEPATNTNYNTKVVETTTTLRCNNGRTETITTETP